MSDFRLWLQADIQSPEIEVCSYPNTGHSAKVRRATSETASPTELGSSEVVLSPQERDLIAIAAGNVAEIDSARPENAHTTPSHPSDDLDHRLEQDPASTRVSSARSSEAA